MLSPSIVSGARHLGLVWDADMAAGFLTGVLQATYLFQLFHGLGLPPRKSIVITLLCCLIRLYAVPSLLRLNCWVA